MNELDDAFASVVNIFVAHATVNSASDIIGPSCMDRSLIRLVGLIVFDDAFVAVVADVFAADADEDVPSRDFLFSPPDLLPPPTTPLLLFLPIELSLK